MKRTIFYLAPLLLILLIVESCSKTPKAIDYQAPTFTGSYTGKLARIHENLTTGVLDSAYDNDVILSLNSDGTFTVTGDTTTLQAGSLGKYALGYQDDLTFTDKTAPATGATAKAHLNGDYAYTYNSGILDLKKVVGDSIAYEYSLTKN